MDPDFINLYIEKLNTKVCDLTKQTLIIETQFEYNTKAATENLQELEELRESSANKERNMSDTNEEIKRQFNLKCDEVANLTSEIQNLNNQLQILEESNRNKDMQFRDMINIKNAALHDTTLKTEQAQKDILLLKAELEKHNMQPNDSPNKSKNKKLKVL